MRRTFDRWAPWVLVALYGAIVASMLALLFLGVTP